MQLCWSPAWPSSSRPRLTNRSSRQQHRPFLCRQSLSNNQNVASQAQSLQLSSSRLASASVVACAAAKQQGNDPATSDEHEQVEAIIGINVPVCETMLTRVIRQANPKQLLQLAKQRYHMLNCIHLSAIYTRLKGLCDIQPALLQQPHTQQLLQLLQQRLPSVQQNSTVRELSTVLWAASFLGCTDVIQQLLPLILQPQHLEAAISKTVVLVLLGLEHAGFVLEQRQAQQLLAPLTDVTHYVCPDDVGTSLRIVATMGLVVPQQQLQELVNRFAAQVRQARVNAVADILWALSTMRKLQEVAPSQLQLLLQAAADRVDDASPAATARIQGVLAEVESFGIGPGDIAANAAALHTGLQALEQQPQQHQQQQWTPEASSLDPSLLTAYINKATTVEKLVWLMQQHGRSMNTIHACAVLKQLKTMCDGDAGLVEQPATQQLLAAVGELVLRVQEDCNAQHCVNIIWASGCLGCAPVAAAVLPRFLQPAVLQQAPVQAITAALFSLATCHVALDQQQVTTLCSALLQQLPDAKPLDIRRSLISFARLGRPLGSDQLTQLVTGFTSKLDYASVGEVADVLGAVAAMQQVQLLPPEQLQQLLRAAADGLSEADPDVVAKISAVIAQVEEQTAAGRMTQGPSDVCTSAASLRNQQQQDQERRQQQQQQQRAKRDGSVHHTSTLEPPLLTAYIKQAASSGDLLQLLQEHGHSMDSIHASALINRLKVLCDRDMNLLKQPVTQQLLDVAEKLVQRVQGECGVQQYVNMIWACGFLQCGSIAALLLAHILLPDNARGLSAAMVTSVLFGVGRCRLPLQQPQAQVLCASLLRGPSSVQPQHISGSLHSLAELQVQLPLQQLLLLVAGYTQPTVLCSAKLESVADFLWALSIMQQADVVTEQQFEVLLQHIQRQLPQATTRQLTRLHWAAECMQAQGWVPTTQHQQLRSVLPNTGPDPFIQQQTVLGVGRNSRSSSSDIDNGNTNSKGNSSGSVGSGVSMQSGQARRAIAPPKLTSMIVDTETPQQLLAVVQQHGADMNTINLAAAFKRAQVFVTADAAVLRQSTTQTLLQQLQKIVGQQDPSTWRARELSSTIWASGYLGSSCHGVISTLLPLLLQPDVLQQAVPLGVSSALVGVAKSGIILQPEQVETLLSSLVTNIQQTAPQQVSNSLWAIATLGTKAPDRVLQQLLQRFADTLQAAKSQEVANTLWATATLGVAIPNSQQQALLDRFIATLDDAVPQGISNVLWALGTTQPPVTDMQLQALLAALGSKLREANSQAVSNSLWGVATLGKQVPAELLQRLLQHLVACSDQGAVQHVPVALWAVATMQVPVPEQLLKWLMDSVLQRLPQLGPQDLRKMLWAAATMRLQVPQKDLHDIAVAMRAVGPDLGLQTWANSLWAFWQFRHHPGQLLDALETSPAVQVSLQSVEPCMRMVNLAGVAYACAVLGYSSATIPYKLLQQAAVLLQQHPDSCSQPRALANLCWAAAVLDARGRADIVLQLAAGCGGNQWETADASGRRQLYQVHVWLQDAGGSADGLLGVLTEHQLAECQQAWAEQQATAPVSSLQQQVFATVSRAPASLWKRAPVEEHPTADGFMSIDIHAVTQRGYQLAIEVDGPLHFLQPNNRLDGPTQSRNRALEIRGYKVVSIPYWEWDAATSAGLQDRYLARKLQPFC